MNGLILQRDASLQALHGSVIDISNGYSRLKKGDLLFFGSKVNENQHITHVAIYWETWSISIRLKSYDKQF